MVTVGFKSHVDIAKGHQQRSLHPRRREAQSSSEESTSSSFSHDGDNDGSSCHTTSSIANAEWIEYIGYNIESGVIENEDHQNDLAKDEDKNKRGTISLQGFDHKSTGKVPEIRVYHPSGSLAPVLLDVDQQDSPKSPLVKYDATIEDGVEGQKPWRPVPNDINITWGEGCNPAESLMEARQSYARRRGRFWESAVQVLTQYQLHPLYLTESEYIELVLTRGDETRQWLYTNVVLSKEIECRSINSILESRSKLEKHDIEPCELRTYDLHIFELMKPDEQDFFITQWKILRGHVTLCNEGLYLGPDAFEAFINVPYSKQSKHLEILKDEADRKAFLDTALSTANKNTNNDFVEEMLFDKAMNICTLPLSDQGVTCETGSSSNISALSNSLECTLSLTTEVASVDTGPKSKRMSIRKAAQSTLTQKLFNAYSAQKIKKQVAKAESDQDKLSNEVGYHESLATLTARRGPKRLRKSLSKVFGSMKLKGQNGDGEAEPVREVYGALDLEA